MEAWIKGWRGAAPARLPEPAFAAAAGGGRVEEEVVPGGWGWERD